MAKAKIICVFKYKEDVLFKVYDYGTCFFCEWNWEKVDWSKYNDTQRLTITEAFKSTKKFKTIEEFRQKTEHCTSDYKFIWED